jgi:predicted RNase H-like HicB family nuclease
MSEPWFRFTVAVHGDEDGALWAEVETWPGTFASGGTFEELWEALGEAVLLVEDAVDIIAARRALAEPGPSIPLEQVQAELDRETPP